MLRSSGSEDRQHPFEEISLSSPSQVHRFCFALALFHLLLSAALVGVRSTKTKRAAIQNGCAFCRVRSRIQLTEK